MNVNWIKLVGAVVLAVASAMNLPPQLVEILTKILGLLQDNALASVGLLSAAGYASSVAYGMRNSSHNVAAKLRKSLAEAATCVDELGGSAEFDTAMHKAHTAVGSLVREAVERERELKKLRMQVM